MSNQQDTIFNNAHSPIMPWIGGKRRLAKITPEMRQAFDGLTMESVPITYTVGGVGRNRTKTAELIIRNW